MAEPKEYLTPSGRLETTIHQVKDIAVGKLQEGRRTPEAYRYLTIETAEGLKYQLTLFADKEDDLTVRFSG